MSVYASHPINITIHACYSIHVPDHGSHIINITVYDSQPIHVTVNGNCPKPSCRANARWIQSCRIIILERSVIPKAEKELTERLVSLNITNSNSCLNFIYSWRRAGHGNNCLILTYIQKCTIIASLPRISCKSLCYN